MTTELPPSATAEHREVDVRDDRPPSASEAPAEPPRQSGGGDGGRGASLPVTPGGPADRPDTVTGWPDGKHKWWQTALEIRIQRLESLLAQESNHRNAATVAHVRDLLLRARSVIASYNQQRWIRKLGRAGSTYEHALGFVLAASEDVLLLLSDDALAANAQTLRGRVKSELPASDPRRDGYIRFLDNIVAAAPPASRS